MENITIENVAGVLAAVAVIGLFVSRFTKTKKDDIFFKRAWDAISKFTKK